LVDAASQANLGVAVLQDIDDVSFENQITLGIKLVNMFTRHLKGAIKRVVGDGTTCKITFPKQGQETAHTLAVS